MKRLVFRRLRAWNRWAIARTPEAQFWLFAWDRAYFKQMVHNVEEPHDV